MKKLLRVSKRTGIWGYGKYWLTLADAKPQIVDFDKLSDDEREVFLAAIATDQLEEFDDNDKKIRKQIIPQEEVQQPVTFATGATSMFENKLLDILEHGINTVRREIDLMKNSNMLSAMLQLEKEGKNRKTALSLIQKQIKKLNKVCGARMDMYDEFVEEETGETITINMEDMVVYSTEKEVEVENKEDLQGKMQEL